ncbi:DUF2971 domain-containing protein [Bradyrhizobium sp. AS23.2]|uniref:DUF2971 domain-containing protein n=1 Tax=Bradyrhizobium sp. AS23.2 TaxID=1680155 RepID=UPI00093981D3|nr:DUF2971 domain-containing protein [Bradyrhizobium sp. AS23.2]OKO69371.1 hypothetical protein AC630_37050 [Bradyrhizobium sp. AS23.2]
MDDDAIVRMFQPLWADLRPEDTFVAKRPLLAHYTTVQTLEKILANNEIWLSNPLFMNDIEEVRFGVIQGNEMVLARQELVDACKTPERAQQFKNAFSHFFNKFANEHILDTYVFCLSDHPRDDNDGRLSMWRGYGANGNGVAIVFDTAQLTSLGSSPLIIAKVSYETNQARLAWLQNTMASFEALLAGANIPDEKLYLAAHTLFERIKMFALFSKHRGFIEEQEWRVVYLPDRDKEQKLHSMFHYWIGPRGVEPKLRFKVQPIPKFTADDLSLNKITDRIILGPSISSPLARVSMDRMLNILNQPELKSKLRISTIPFRAIG